MIERFGDGVAQGSAGGTGIAFYNGGLYAEQNDKIIRYPLPADCHRAARSSPKSFFPALPLTGDHPMHPFIIDQEGTPVRRPRIGDEFAARSKTGSPNSPGHQPCTELETRAGTWRYEANKKDQHFSPAERYATGLRNGEGFRFRFCRAGSS